VFGRGEPAKKKNQASKASAAATTLITTTRSTPLIPSRRRATSSLSPRMLRSQGEVRRAACGRPLSSSYAAVRRASSRARTHPDRKQGSAGPDVNAEQCRTHREHCPLEPEQSWSFPARDVLGDMRRPPQASLRRRGHRLAYSAGRRTQNPCRAVWTTSGSRSARVERAGRWPSVSGVPTGSGLSPPRRARP
jgi:hypothetical protein